MKYSLYFLRLVLIVYGGRLLSNNGGFNIYLLQLNICIQKMILCVAAVAGVVKEWSWLKYGSNIVYHNFTDHWGSSGPPTRLLTVTARKLNISVLYLGTKLTFMIGCTTLLKLLESKVAGVALPDGKCWVDPETVNGEDKSVSWPIISQHFWLLATSYGTWSSFEDGGHLNSQEYFAIFQRDLSYLENIWSKHLNSSKLWVACIILT